MFIRLVCQGLAAAALLPALLLPAAPALAQVTSLTLASDPGDYVGQGQTLSYAADSGSFSAQVNTGGGVSINFNTPSFDHWWALDFAAPGGAALRQGTYVGAMRFPFQATNAPGLSVTGDGRSCNTLSGSFTVNQIVYGTGGTVAAFDATFEQHCEGVAPALRGQIRYNANVPLYLAAPSQLQVLTNQNLRFLVTATDAQRRRVVLTASALPPGASFVDLGNNTGSFSWTPAPGQVGTWVATFVGDNGQGNRVTASSQISVITPPPANDDFGAPVVLPAIPYTVSQDATRATRAADDPSCLGNDQSVWFSFTPRTDMRIEANTFGSGYDTTLSVYTGSRGVLNSLACNDDAGDGLQSRVRFDATAGTTYHFMAAALNSPATTASLVFNLLPAPPPFTVAPSVAPFGKVVPSTGAAVISGTIQCSSPTLVTLGGQVKQVRGGVPITGFWNAFVECKGTTRWSADVLSQVGLFKGRAAALFSGGPATVNATAQAFDPESGEVRIINLSTRIVLRGGK